MAMRKYQSTQSFEPLRGDLKKAAQKVASSKSKLADATLSDQDRLSLEAEHRKASAKLAE